MIIMDALGANVLHCEQVETSQKCPAFSSAIISCTTALG
jgi:hypothetical protein